MKEKAKNSKYSKMRKALSELIDSSGDKNQERIALDKFIKESNKYMDEFNDNGMSKVLQLDFNHRLSTAHAKGNKEILAGTAMGYHMILQQTKVWE
tara:strand:- start:255 stop:542 length:288 start_codon:yes stop_codon:yes gene_type:complete